MKFKALVLLATTFVSVTASASWYVSSVSCSQTPDPANPNQVIYTSFRSDSNEISHGFIERNGNGAMPTPLPYADAFKANYANKTKINPRSVWNGIFDVIEIYDGMNLDGGQITFSNGTVAETKAEIRFLPYTDKAYGPDYANVVLWTKSPSSQKWSPLMSLDQCYVSVYH